MNINGNKVISFFGIIKPLYTHVAHFQVIKDVYSNVLVWLVEDHSKTGSSDTLPFQHLIDQCIAFFKKSLKFLLF